MKSPYKQGFGQYEDIYPGRTIFPEEERIIGLGYKFLGWNSGYDLTPELIHCLNEGHNYSTIFPGVWQSKQHNSRGSDVTQWCTKCKIYWKVDMGD